MFTQTLSDLTLNWSKVRSDKLLCVNTALETRIDIWWTRTDDSNYAILCIASNMVINLRRFCGELSPLLTAFSGNMLLAMHANMCVL